MPAKYYVYELIDPRDGRPFYVGKGSGKRVHQHEKDAKAGAELGRFDRIKEIWADGLTVEKRILARFDDEAEAYAAESARIAEIGSDNLTNWTTGAGFDAEAYRDRTLLPVLAQIGLKTNGFTAASRMWFGQQWHPVPASFAKAMGERFAEILTRRGREWAAGILGKGIPYGMPGPVESRPV